MSRKKRSYADMFKMKTEEYRPFFNGGHVKTLDAFVREKDILKYNSKNGIEDTRKKESTVDLLTLNTDRHCISYQTPYISNIKIQY